MPPPAEHNERLRHSNVLTEEAVRLTESCMLLYDIYEEIACQTDKHSLPFEDQYHATMGNATSIASNGVNGLFEHQLFGNSENH